MRKRCSRPSLPLPDCSSYEKYEGDIAFVNPYLCPTVHLMRKVERTLHQLSAGDETKQFSLDTKISHGGRSKVFILLLDFYILDPGLGSGG